MIEPHDIQKQLILARLMQILGSKDGATSWMAKLRPEFADKSGNHSANEMIEGGYYEKVLEAVGRMG